MERETYCLSYIDVPIEWEVKMDKETMWLKEPIKRPNTPAPPEGDHYWDVWIVGYRPQAEPSWVTTSGYRPPIEKYKCRRCGKKFQNYGSSISVRLFYMERCDGSFSVNPTVPTKKLLKRNV